MEDRRRRPSNRLDGYDYASASAYFVTITLQSMDCLFGVVADGVVALSIPGLMVESWWGTIERRFDSVELGSYVVMPNHLHGIVFTGVVPESRHSDRGEGDHIGSPVRTIAAHPEQFVWAGQRGRPASNAWALDSSEPSLSDVVGWFKTMTTNDYIRGVKEYGFPPFERRLWHRTFYDHIIRNDADLARIEEYIAGNPTRGTTDEFHSG
jgi:putative transposase